MTSPLAARVAAEIRAEMGRRKMTQAALARALGKSEMYISRRVGNGIDLEIADLEAIAELFGMPVISLLPVAERAA